MPEIIGDSGNNTLVGTNDPDIIRGLGGNDVIYGRGGLDELFGGQGDDIYFIDDNAGDVIRELIGEGSDSVYVSVSYALTGGSEIELLSTNNHSATVAINLTGNGFAQTIIGNDGANIINGGGGADVLYGRGGNDIYYVDVASVQIVEAVGGGTDAVYTSVSYTLGAGQEIELLSVNSTAATTPLTLTGNARAQTLFGNNGANILIGGGGADILYGYGGNDQYQVSDASAQVIEAVGGGTDIVYATVSYTLNAGTEVEVLSVSSFASTTPLNLTGNSRNQTIVGNEGVNILNGGGGTDILDGRGGNDIYLVDANPTRIVEAAGGGTDIVYATASYTLNAGASVETLSVSSYASLTALNLTGNEFGQTLVGNAGANILNGGLGNDILTGNGGADSFAFTTALGAGNVDTITDFVPGTDKILLGGAAGQPFVTLASGTLRAGAFVLGAAAADADDYLIYNSATGALLFDADGAGGAAAVQFATLSTGLSLTAADFLVAGPANNAPAVTSGATASIAENSAVGTIVYQAVATDADGDRVTWSLSGTDAALLTIDANGAVRLINPADFETKASYSFNVVASDSGTATPRAVTLAITDVNESGPTTTIINETGANNDTRLTAQAIDRGTFVVANNPNLPDDDLPSATIVGNLPTSTDVDFFAITLQAGERLILDVDNTSGNLDSFLRVFGPNGAVIGSNDDTGAPDPGSAPHPTYGHNTDSTFSFRAPTSGTYYFSIESFQDPQRPTFGSYEINVSIGPVATPAQIMAEDVDALISGAAWNHTNLTYGFPTQASQYPADFEEVVVPPPPETAPFQAFNPNQIAATQQLLQIIANVSVLTFTQNVGTGNYTVPGSAAAADLRFAESSVADVAYAYYPTNQGPGDEGGSAWFNHVNFNNPVRGNYAWMGILHEIGHALGLKHGHEAPAISPDHDSVEYSVMTYRSYPGAPVGEEGGGYRNETFGYPQTLMMLDMAALQKIYDGANYGFNSGNSVYTWSAATGEMSINGVGQGAPGGNRIFMTIWDGGGTDTYDLSNYNVATVIDLRPGEWTTMGDAQRANLGDGHFARGNVANALLFGGNPASLIENAIGGSARDVIYANQAANSLTGGGGNDEFRWASAGDVGTGAFADTITDFVRNADRIDLSGIDAIAGGADNAFTFIGNSAFHNVAGELRFDQVGNAVHVFGDIDGNGLADLQIIVNNITFLAATDFLL